MKQFIAAAAILAIIACAAEAGEYPREVVVTSSHGVASHTITESNTGPDRIGYLPSALLNFSEAAASTVTVQIVAGSITNAIDPAIDMAGETDGNWVPTAYIYLKVGDTISWTSTETGEVFTVRGWID